MTHYLLDTNVVSELRRPYPHAGVTTFIRQQALEHLFISSVTFAEIRFGIEMVDDPHKRSALHDWLERRVRPMFNNRALPVSEDVMLKWRLLVEQGRKHGRTYPQPDLIIAATALHHGLVVVSRDEGGFAGTGLQIINPWKQASGNP